MLQFFDILLSTLVNFNIVSECLTYLGELGLRCSADWSLHVISSPECCIGHLLATQTHPVRARHPTASQDGFQEWASEPWTSARSGRSSEELSAELSRRGRGSRHSDAACAPPAAPPWGPGWLGHCEDCGGGTAGRSRCPALSSGTNGRSLFLSTSLGRVLLGYVLSRLMAGSMTLFS